MKLEFPFPGPKQHRRMSHLSRATAGGVGRAGGSCPRQTPNESSRRSRLQSGHTLRTRILQSHRKEEASVEVGGRQ